MINECWRAQWESVKWGNWWICTAWQTWLTYCHEWHAWLQSFITLVDLFFLSCFNMHMRVWHPYWLQLIFYNYMLINVSLQRLLSLKTCCFNCEVTPKGTYIRVLYSPKICLLLQVQFHTVKHLGYFNHIFMFSQLHQCDQGMLPNWFSWKFIEKLLL